jgi:flagellar motor switch protein FliM
MAAMDEGGEGRSNDDEEALMREWAAMAGGEEEGGGGEDADAMAAEWEAMLGAGGEEEGGGDAGGAAVPKEAARVLNQDEIDSLLGFDEGHGVGDDKSGIQAILNSALVSYERLPMLEVVFDRLVRMMSTSMRNFTSDNVEVSLDNILSLRFGDYLNSIPLPAMLAVFKAEEWDNYGLLTVDSSLIYSIVDVLLGGRRGTAAMRIEGRPYTTIERNLVERMVHVVLSDLSAAFDPLSPVTFRFDRLETNPRFATISRPSNAAIVAKLRIDMEDRGGRLELLLPYATLEPVRELLLQMFMGEKFGRDSIWETHLAEELWLTEVQMKAVLDEQVMSLNDVLQWKVGSRFMLNALPDSGVEMRCGDINMFRGRMGRKGQHIAIRVDEKIIGEG